MGGILDHWLANDGAELRKWLGSYLPDPLRWIADAPPLWLIEVVAAVVTAGIVLALLSGIGIAVGQIYQIVRRPGKTIRGILDPVKPVTGKDIETITSLVKEVLDSNRFIIQQNESMRQYLGQREGTIEHFLINPDSIGASGFLYRTDELSEALAPKRKG